MHINEICISVGKFNLCDILKVSSRMNDNEASSGTRLNQEKHLELEELFVWVCQINASNGTVSNDIIINKAKIFTQQYKIKQMDSRLAGCKILNIDTTSRVSKHMKSHHCLQK